MSQPEWIVMGCDIPHQLLIDKIAWHQTKYESAVACGLLNAAQRHACIIMALDELIEGPRPYGQWVASYLNNPRYERYRERVREFKESRNIEGDIDILLHATPEYKREAPKLYAEYRDEENKRILADDTPWREIRL